MVVLLASKEAEYADVQEMEKIEMGTVEIAKNLLLNRSCNKCGFYHDVRRVDCEATCSFRVKIGQVLKSSSQDNTCEHWKLNEN